MPLPELIPTYEGFRNHDASCDQAALFNEIYLASPDALAAGTRIACLSQVGVNLVMQRWVNHNSRMVAPSWQYQEVASGPFDEADLIEDWCEERMYAGVGSPDATVEAMKWLREDVNGGLTRQQRLEDPQERSAVRSRYGLISNVICRARPVALMTACDRPTKESMWPRSRSRREQGDPRRRRCEPSSALAYAQAFSCGCSDGSTPRSQRLGR
jgi:hypothetical protein